MRVYSMYNLMNVYICIHFCNHHPYQNIENYQHSFMFLHSQYFPQPRSKHNLTSITAVIEVRYKVHKQSVLLVFFHINAIISIYYFVSGCFHLT